MPRFLLRRALILPLVLLAIHFIAFAYAMLAVAANQAQNPYGAGRLDQPDVLQAYGEYLSEAARLDFGVMPGISTGANPDLEVYIFKAAGASLGLLLLAFILASGAG